MEVDHCHPPQQALQLLAHIVLMAFLVTGLVHIPLSTRTEHPLELPLSTQVDFDCRVVGRIEDVTEATGDDVVCSTEMASIVF